MVTLTIDGKRITASADSTILEAARENDIHIPSLCWLKDINEIAACRVCVVEIEGIDRPIPACDTLVEEGMVIHTNSPSVRAARRLNIELILSQHDCLCATCDRSGSCSLQEMASDFNILDLRYDKDVPKNRWDMNAPLIRYESKCIKCMRCVQVCDKIQSLNIWDVSGTGSRTSVNVSHNRTILESDCSFCGQCITHCPTGALRARDDTQRVYAALADPEVKTIVQVAPAVRAAWGEYFGLSPEKANIRVMAAALRKIGFDYIFDTNFTADLTIMEEGSELIERLTHRDEHKWPMFTSCCPGWIRFAKGQYPDFIDNLSTAKSPQQMLGSITKSFFAEKMGIDPHKLFVVSIMPCVSKKSECEQPNQNDACGDQDVDVALTTRELVRLLRADHLALDKIEEEPLDSPFGNSTGAAVIFGATGGVCDAALRSAYYLVSGKNPDPDAFTDVRGEKGWKEANFNIPGFGVVRVAVVSGLGNTRNLMEAIKRGDAQYDFVEIMACPGGCAGGGGQPIYDGVELADKRGETLWQLDRNQALRFSHENPDIQRLYAEYLEAPLGHKSHQLLHTDHRGWKLSGEE